MGIEAKKYLDAGDLVPATLTNALVDDRLDDADAADGFILDGFHALGGAGRGAARHARAAQPQARRRGRVPGPRGRTGRAAQGRGRADDTEDVIRNRFNVYRDETAPLLDYYRGELKTVDAVGSFDEVFARALHALGR